MLLCALFFIIALFYASVGFGGGSSYIALLVLWDVPFMIVPIIALLCNITVVSGSSINYVKAGHLNLRLFLSVAILSIPMAYIGGSLPIDKITFKIILACMLVFTGAHLLIQHRGYKDSNVYREIPAWVSTIIGAVLGFLAGIVGIGGGIFLAPILYYMRAGTPKQIATTASLFILVNSIAGLAGQMQKTDIVDIIQNYWYLPIVVLVGGQIGNILTLRIFSSQIIALFTAILILFVAGRLWLNILGI